MAKSVSYVAAVLLWSAAGPVWAQQAPVTEAEPDAEDVVSTPLTDLNLKKGEIPELLQHAVDQPYDLNGLSGCRALIAEVGRLDALLGDDYDLSAGSKGRLTAGDVGKFAVGSLIPFRSLIREVSGASSEQRKLQNAIRAGMARRGFLKGVGHARGCAWPARPANEADVRRIEAERAAAERREDD
ncbi:hypothetical protein [Erythrobacter mangrovi]|uniref:Uncharacterized protein n=1 Tax=Erythrobacter mangrovi TaxID=2739433 RepID=A0A7D4BA62_9SPHN|nr:hypothetical protein [Erythrobacter mangrovi]QKG70626.1 hypothetical protein HQR01_04150 [Erythrobacter mangrovi]